jgi:hypothetical protein
MRKKGFNKYIYIYIEKVWTFIVRQEHEEEYDKDMRESMAGYLSRHSQFAEGGPLVRVVARENRRFNLLSSKEYVDRKSKKSTVIIFSS